MNFEEFTRQAEAECCPECSQFASRANPCPYHSPLKDQCPRLQRFACGLECDLYTATAEARRGAEYLTGCKVTGIELVKWSHNPSFHVEIQADSPRQILLPTMVGGVTINYNPESVCVGFYCKAEYLYAARPPKQGEEYDRTIF